MRFESLEDRLPLASFVVTNTASDGDGSLAAAITSANAAAGSDTILFNISEPTPITIFSTSLPTITDAVVIDATTQPGFVDRPLIVLRGIESQAGGGAAGFRIETNNTLVRGFIFNRFNSGSLQNGAAVTMRGNGNRVEGSWIGTDTSGTISDPNALGVLIETGSGNIVGGTTASQRNVISGNQKGVVIRSSNNRVEGNYIGTDPGGRSSVANQTGVAVEGGQGNVIGFTGSGQQNVISGNKVGVLVKSSSNRVAGNRIGTSADGLSSLPNEIGVSIEGGTGSVIGGTEVEQRNVISGNQTGVSIASSNNRVAGNWIGVDTSGRTLLPNTVGIRIAGSENVVGGTSDGQANLISGNETGVILTGNTNRMEANRIGTDESGTTALANQVGVQIDGEGNIVGGPAVNQGNVISGNTTGLLINGNRTRVQANRIGTDANGNFAVGNVTGIRIVVGVENTIGGLTAADRNVISANDTGIAIEDARSTLVQGNYIGIDSQGLAALGNVDVGVQVTGGDNLNNQIGGTQPGAGNVISGNGGFGVVLAGNGNFVQGNRIGRRAGDPESFGNGGGGILVTAANNRIGGPEENAGNVISGNQLGIRVVGSGASANVIQGNVIGVDFSGQPVPNTSDGIELAGPDNSVGGATIDAGNVISANGRHGIWIHDTDARNNVVSSNTIGIDAAGTTNLPNLGDGIRVENTGVDSGNVIGGASVEEGNRIAFNEGAGIAVLETSPTVGRSTGTQIRFNQIVANGGIGIDLGPDGFPDGVTPNDPGDVDTGPNELQNYPELTSVLAGNPTRIVGRLDSQVGQTYVIDFYASPSIDGVGHVEGRRYLGSTTIGPDDLTFDVQLPVQTQPLDYITATATSIETSGVASQGTSEFSPLGLIEGTKFLDFLSDGITPDDDPLADFSIQLYLDDGDGAFDAEQDLLVETAVTNDDGLYRFQAVRPGRHFVVEMEDERFLQTAGGDQFPEIPYFTIDMISLGEFLERDFANYKVPRLGGKKVIDIDNNGVTDNDPPKPDWGIDLFLDDGDGSFDPDLDELISTTLTDEDGRYEFVGAAPGFYFVVEVLQGDYEQTGGGDDFPNIPYYGRTVVGGTEIDNLDFANFDFPDFKGITFVDITGDGISDDDERHPAQIIQLWLDDGDGNFDPAIDQLQRIDITNLEGKYEFIRVTPGVYHVVEVVMEDYVQTDGGDDFPSRPYYTIEVENEVNHLDLDFSNSKVASIGGRLFWDRTADGITVDDSPQAGWNILLYRDTDRDRQFNPPNDNLVRTLATDVDGFYTFEGIPPGRYYVVDEPKERVRQTDGGSVFPLRPYFVVDLLSGEDVEGKEFANGDFFPTGFRIRSMAASDFDGDGDVDLAVVNEKAGPYRPVGSLSVLNNDGTGQFPTTTPVAVAGRPQSVMAADMDGNGFEDLIITAIGNGRRSNSVLNRVIVIYNAGNGIFFRRAVVANVGDGPIDIVASDFDGDGDLDLAVTNFRSNDITILLNQRRGEFTMAGRVAVGNQPIAIASIDLNDDGTNDLVVANFKSHTLSLLINNGRARFTKTDSVASVLGPADLAVGDWDGDGQDDVAVAGFLSDQVAIHYNLRVNSQGGAVGDRRAYLIGTPLQATRPQAILPVDYDADGDLDLIVAASEVSVSVVLENRGERIFTIGDILPTAGGPESIVAADFDGNQSPDVASSTLYRVFNDTVPVAVSLGGVNITNNRNVDVKATISNNRNIVVPGERLTYTVRIRNNGPNRVDNVSVTSQLPDSLSNVVYTSSVDGVGSGNTPAGVDQINDIVNLDRDSEIIYLVTGTIDPATRDEFQVGISTTVPDRFVETNPDNNQAIDLDDVLPVVDVSVNTDDGLDEGDIVIPGVDSVTYVITASNAGPGLATGLKIANQLELPAGTGVGLTVTNKGEIDFNTLDWTFDELAVDEVATLRIVVRVSDLARPGDVIRHTVFVESLEEIDSELSNNLSTVTTPIGDVGPEPEPRDTNGTARAAVTADESRTRDIEEIDEVNERDKVDERDERDEIDERDERDEVDDKDETNANDNLGNRNADFADFAEGDSSLVGDFDGDGVSDVASWVAGQWVVSSSRRSSSTTWGAWSRSVRWVDLLVGDVNGDGRDDVVGRVASGQWWVGLSTGTTFRNERWGQWSTSVQWSDVQIDDVSGDGRADLVGRTDSGQWWVSESRGREFVNRRAVDVLAALGALNDDDQRRRFLR